MTLSQAPKWHGNQRDPLVQRMIGPGKAWELEPVLIGGHEHEAFKGAPRNLAGLCRQALLFGDRPMIVQGGLVLTFAESFARVAALSAFLAERHGVGRGSRVAVIAANRPEWIIALIAVTSLGAVAALVNSRGVAEEMLRAVELVGCQVVIADAERDAILSAARPDPTWPRVVIGDPAAPLRAGRDSGFDAACAEFSGTPFDPLNVDLHEGAIVLYTSGTTGFPKGALISHGALAHSVSVAAFMGALQDLRYEEEIGEVLPPESRSMASPAVILGPMFHLSGIMPSLRAIAVGATIHILGKWNADVALDMIEHTGMTRLSFVSAMLFDILRHPRATPDVLRKVRYLVNGAAPLDMGLVAQIRERLPHCQLANGYGQTEGTAWTCGISGQVYLEHPASCGWAAPTVKVQLRRDDGSEPDMGEPGELWVSSPMLMTGYVGDAQATSAALQDGWLASGDIATVNTQGIYTIVDRKKNMVISGGENIYCAEVERVLQTMPGVREVIAYGVPDARLNERLAVTVLAEADAALTGDAIKAHCRAHLALYKVPREVAFAAAPLPRTASGKIDRGTFLRQIADAG